MPLYNSKIKSERYIKKFIKAGPNIYDNVANYGKNMVRGELFLILDPNEFFYLDLWRTSGIVYYKDIEKESENLKKLKNTPGKFLGKALSQYAPYIGESPSEIFYSNLEFLCIDGKKRLMCNYSEAKAYIFLPHPTHLENFVGALRKIPIEYVKTKVIEQLKEYYKNRL